MDREKIEGERLARMKSTRPHDGAGFVSRPSSTRPGLIVALDRSYLCRLLPPIRELMASAPVLRSLGMVDTFSAVSHAPGSCEQVCATCPYARFQG